MALAEEMLSGLPRKPEDADPAALTLHKLTGSSAGDEALRRLVFSSGSQEQFCCGRVSIFLQSDLLLPPLPNPTLRVPPWCPSTHTAFPLLTPSLNWEKLFRKMIQKSFLFRNHFSYPSLPPSFLLTQPPYILFSIFTIFQSPAHARSLTAEILLKLLLLQREHRHPTSPHKPWQQEAPCHSHRARRAHFTISCELALKTAWRQREAARQHQVN